MTRRDAVRFQQNKYERSAFLRNHHGVLFSVWKRNAHPPDKFVSTPHHVKHIYRVRAGPRSQNAISFIRSPLIASRSSFSSSGKWLATPWTAKDPQIVLDQVEY